MTTLNTESLNLFGVPFKHLNCAQRLDLYRALELGDDAIDGLEALFSTPEDIADKISRQEYGVPYDQLRFAGQKRNVLKLAIDYELEGLQSGLDRGDHW
jgi:hypothetical protein